MSRKTDDHIDSSKLLFDCINSLKTEIDSLRVLSSYGKLSSNSSRDLIEYIKLLNELKKQEDASVSNMTDDELIKYAENSLKQNPT